MAAFSNGRLPLVDSVARHFHSEMALDFIAGSCGGLEMHVKFLLFLLFFHSGASGIFTGYPFDTVKVSKT